MRIININIKYSARNRILNTISFGVFIINILFNIIKIVFYLKEKVIVVESNDISQNIMTNDKSNSWADKRSKIVGNYIAGEMLMNKNQQEFIVNALYSKYSRNNDMTTGKNLTDSQKETIYKETFSLIKGILLDKFTKKQVDSILEYESEKLSTL